MPHGNTLAAACKCVVEVAQFTMTLPYFCLVHQTWTEMLEGNSKNTS